jgi:hypothetical protein
MSLRRNAFMAQPSGSPGTSIPSTDCGSGTSASYLATSYWASAR